MEDWPPKTEKDLKALKKKHLDQLLRQQELKDSRMAMDAGESTTIGRYTGQSSDDQPQIFPGSWGKYDDLDDEDISQEEAEIEQGHFPGSDSIRIFRFGSH